MSEQLKITIIDTGYWAHNTFKKEIETKRRDVQIENVISVPRNAPIKEVLDAVPQSIGQPTVLWLPYTYEECHKTDNDGRILLEQFLALRDSYPDLRVHFYYENMNSAFLHEIARKEGVVAFTDKLDENLDTVPDPVKIEFQKKMEAIAKAEEEKEKAKLTVGDNPNGKETVIVDPKNVSKKEKKNG